MVTDRPRVCKSAPSEAAAKPLPSEDKTPPVTKINLVFMASHLFCLNARFRVTAC